MHKDVMLAYDPIISEIVLIKAERQKSLWYHLHRAYKSNST